MVDRMWNVQTVNKHMQNECFTRDIPLVHVKIIGDIVKISENNFFLFKSLRFFRNYNSRIYFVGVFTHYR